MNRPENRLPDQTYLQTQMHDCVEPKFLWSPPW